MSFRSASVLPTCLHGRLALRRLSQLRGHAACPKCQYSIAQGAAIQDDDVHAKPIELTPSDASEGLRIRQAPLYYNANLHSKSKPINLPHTRRRTDPASTLTPENRVARRLKVPDFIKPALRTQNAVRTDSLSAGLARDRQIKPTSPILKDELFIGGYKEWEEWHDKFLEVRRKQPDRTAEIFSSEARLARNFVGDFANPETSPSDLTRNWFALTDEEKKKILPQLLVGSLATSAAMSLFVLQNISSMPYSFLIRMNCLRDIGVMYWKTLQLNPELKVIYEDQINDLRPTDAWPKNKMPTVLLQNLLFWSTPEQCSTIIKNFFKRYPDADPSCLVAIIDHYLRIEDRDRAIEYIGRLPAELLLQPNAIIQELRDRLLKMDIVAKSEGGTNFKYLPQLLALGIPSDQRLHNAVIESAILNGLPDVAWDLYQYLESSKFQSNARSHLVLLRDAFQRSDLERVDNLMTAIHHREDLISDQYLMAYSMNIVRVISYYEKQLGPNEARSHIMALYDRAYDRAPLTRLGIVQPLKHSVDSRTDLLEPPPTLLAFTVWTYILTQRYDGNVLRLWQWLKHLVSSGDSSIVQTMKFDIIYHGLMLFHARRANTLFRALEIVQYMLSEQLCLPTSRTWSILLCAYLRHDQVEQAEKILAMMQSKGIKVQEVNEKYSSYMPAGYDLRSMADEVSKNLNERDMPGGIEDLLADSGSLQDEKQFPVTGDSDGDK